MHCPVSAYPDGENIDVAIQVVGEAKKESLTQHLTDYLMGEVDEIPKVPLYSVSVPKTATASTNNKMISSITGCQVLVSIVPGLGAVS